jgi:predicted nucleotidyltransferase/DNA-binding XRE family transcriptional regulator
MSDTVAGVDDHRAGALIRRARRDASLSQTELGRRAGVAQSVISAYETGRREPSVEVLRKLVEAAGHDLAISIEPRSDQPRALTNTTLSELLRRRRGEVLDRAARCGASNVRVFGSVARGEDTSASDIDLLVDLAEDVGLLGLGRLEREIGEVLGVAVDVVPASALKARLRDEVLSEAVPL